MADTVRLKLPLIDPAQAQKHVTLNEALVLLDLLVGVIPVLSRTLSAPPMAADGAVYILAGDGAGAWTGFGADDLALCLDGGWRRVLPSAGMVASVAAEGGAQLTWSGTQWVPLGGTRARLARSRSLTKANDAALAADPVLQFSMQPNATYSIAIEVFFTAPIGPGFQYALSGPAGLSRVQVETRLRAPGATSELVGGALALPGATAVAGALENFGCLRLSLAVETGSAGGSFAFQWAQAAANAAGVTVRSGSSLEWALVPEPVGDVSPFALAVGGEPVAVGGEIITIGDP